MEARGVSSREAKQRSSDGGCGGPGLGPPGPGSQASRDIPSPTLQAQGLHRRYQERPGSGPQAFLQNRPPRLRPLPPQSVQSLVPMGLGAAHGGSLGVLLPNCGSLKARAVRKGPRWGEPDLPSPQCSPLPGEWGRQAWSVGPAGGCIFQCRLLGSQQTERVCTGNGEGSWNWNGSRVLRNHNRAGPAAVPREEATCANVTAAEHRDRMGKTTTFLRLQPCQDPEARMSGRTQTRELQSIPQ